jgi:hypothetical protein
MTLGRSLKKSKRRATIWTALKVGVLVVAVALALIPLPAGWVERFYSRGIYPWVQSWLTPLTNRISFSVGDVLLIALALAFPIWWIIRIKSARGRRSRAVASLFLKSLVAIAIIYLAFLVLWGFNYQRLPLMAKLDYDEARLTEDARYGLLRTTIERLNTDSESAHSLEWPSEERWRSQLLDGFNRIVIELGNRRGIAPAVPKTSLADVLLGKTGVGGFTNPFGLEVILNSDLLPIERPFTVAHEWAHLAGFADEAEANFIALLACGSSETPAIRYSAWLALFPYLQLHERPARPEDRRPHLAPEVIADLHAIAERASRRMSPKMSEVQGRVYDGFLKANRVQAGIGSYGLFVRLMLGTRFETEWVPARRN